MKLRLGVFFAATLLFAGGCASSSGGGSGSGTSLSDLMAAGSDLPQGERPRENTETRSANRALEAAEEAASEAEAEASYREAVSFAEQAIAADSTNPLPHLQMGQAYLGLGDYVAADEWLDRAEELRPVYQIETERLREAKWIELYNNAMPLVQAGDYEGAVVLFEGADVLYAVRPEAKITLGQLQVQLGRYEDAVPTLRQALEMIANADVETFGEETVAAWQDSGAQLPLYIAQSLIYLERYDEAIVEFQGLLAQDPDNNVYLNQLASLYYQTDQPEEAQKIYEQMRASGNLGPQELYNIGVGYYQSDDYVGAADAFGDAAEVSVNDRDAIEMQTRSLRLAYPPGEGEATPPEGALEELVEAAKRWVALDPASRNGLLILAQTDSRLGRNDEAAELVQSIEDLPFVVNNLQLRRNNGGGGLVSGSVSNQNAAAGSTATLRFTFYDRSGAAIGEAEANIILGEADSAQSFEVEFDSDAEVGGYGYVVVN